MAQKYGRDSLYAIVLGRMLSYSVSKTEGLRQGGSVESVSRKSSLVENHRPRTNRFEGPQTGCVEDGSGKLNESSSLAYKTLQQGYVRMVIFGLGLQVGSAMNTGRGAMIMLQRQIAAGGPSHFVGPFF